jgi:hypothetical protein
VPAPIVDEGKAAARFWFWRFAGLAAGRGGVDLLRGAQDAGKSRGRRREVSAPPPAVTSYALAISEKRSPPATAQRCCWSSRARAPPPG